MTDTGSTDGGQLTTWSYDAITEICHEIFNSDESLHAKQMSVLWKMMEMHSDFQLARADLLAKIIELQAAIAAKDEALATLEVDKAKLQAIGWELQAEVRDTLERLIGVQEWFEGTSEEKYEARYRELTGTGPEGEAGDE